MKNMMVKGQKKTNEGGEIKQKKNDRNKMLYLAPYFSSKEMQ